MFCVSDRAGMPVARAGDRLFAAAGGIPSLYGNKNGIFYCILAASIAGNLPSEASGAT